MRAALALVMLAGFFVLAVALAGGLTAIAIWLAPATTVVVAKSPAQGLMPASRTSAPNAIPKIAQPTIKGAIALQPSQASDHWRGPMRRKVRRVMRASVSLTRWRR